jgi:hypothetical protein
MTPNAYRKLARDTMLGTQKVIKQFDFLTRNRIETPTPIVAGGLASGSSRAMRWWPSSTPPT